MRIRFMTGAAAVLLAATPLRSQDAPSGAGSPSVLDTPSVGEAQPDRPLELSAPVADLLPDVPAATAPNPVDTASFLARAKPPGAPRKVTLQEALSLALDNNLQIKAMRLEPEVRDQFVRAAFGAFDPALRFSMNYQYSKVPQNAEEFVATGGENAEQQQALVDSLEQLLAEITGEPVKQTEVSRFTDPRLFTNENLLFSYELGGLLPTGMTYSFFLDQAELRNDINREIPPSLFYPEYSTFAGIRLRQPLLKNFGPAATMAPIRVARLDRKIGWFDWERQLIDTLQATILAYYDLFFAWKNVRVQENQLELATLLESANLQRLKAGRMNQIDAVQAQSLVSSALTRVFSAYEQVITANGRLKSLIFAMPEQVDNLLFETPTELTVPINEKTRPALLAEALAKRPEYRKAVAEAEKQGIRVRYARNQSLPDVSLVGTYGVNGLNGEWGSSLGDAAGGQGQTVVAGVEVSIPLGFVKERADLSAAKIRRQQAEIDVQQAGLSIRIEIDTALSLVKSAGMQREVAAQATRFSLDSLNAEKKLLEVGKTTTLNVVDSQNAYALAIARELEAEILYHRAMIRLSTARGALLDDLGIQVTAEAIRTAGKPATKIKNLPPAL